MKLIAVIGGLALALTGSAQPDQARIDAIWSVAGERIANQIDVWFDDGDFPAAIQLLKVQYEMYPGDYEVATNLGWMQENIELWDDAIATYMRFHRENPKDPDAPLALADFFFRKRSFGKIAPLLEPVLEREPHPNAYRILAHSYSRLNMLGDSLRVWDAYLALKPDDAAAKVNRERVLKKIEEAKKKGG